MQYAQDAMETSEPWELWEYSHASSNGWRNLDKMPSWRIGNEYRRKPKMISVTLMDGEVVSWPEPEKNKPNRGFDYFHIQGSCTVKQCWFGDNDDMDRLDAGFVHLSCDAVNAHRDALLKINNQVAK